MSASRSLPVWVWPVALGLFLVGAVVFGRAFKEERSRILRVERKLGTLQELQGLAETRLPITGAESRLAEVAGETLVDPLGWFAKENVKVEMEVLPAAMLAGGANTAIAVDGSAAALELAEVRKRNLDLMEQLNPGRVFRVAMPPNITTRSLCSATTDQRVDCGTWR